jgi:hypothetical protein
VIEKCVDRVLLKEIDGELDKIDEEVSRFADLIGLTCSASNTELKMKDLKVHGTIHPASDKFHGFNV